MHASQRKCWYCETPVDRQPGAIDHFRPKGGVTGIEHEGYWWLAYDWRNYRYSCTLCNSAHTNPGTGITEGKANHFPLLEEATRAYEVTDDIEGEQPLLLDPTNIEDPQLLAFDQDGNAAPRSLENQDAVGHRRAKWSIIAYHLNHPQTSERRKALFDYIKHCIVTGDKLLFVLDNAKLDIKGRRVLKELFERNADNLTGCVRAKGEYSAAAKGFLLGFRDRRWVEELLNCG